MAILRFIPRLSNVLIQNLSIFPLAAMLTACGLEVQDNTLQPATYSSGGYQIRANVNTHDSAKNPSVASSVTILGSVQSVAMSEVPGGGSNHAFAGVWPVSPLYSPTTDACGFGVHHAASAKLFWIIPVHGETTRQISGNPTRQGIMLADPHIYAQVPAVFTRLTPGTMATGPVTINEELVILSLYTSPPVTIQSVRVLCGNTDCSATTNPPVQNIEIPVLPVTLACGLSTVVHAQCTDKAIQDGVNGKSSGTFVVTTNTTRFSVPFRCWPQLGA
jgi:hypothetical protein